MNGKIASPLNILEKYIQQNQFPKLKSFIIENNAIISTNNLEINQSYFVIYTVEDYQKVWENILYISHKWIS